jgi:hypothetical protein
MRSLICALASLFVAGSVLAAPVKLTTKERASVRSFVVQKWSQQQFPHALKKTPTGVAKLPSVIIPSLPMRSFMDDASGRAYVRPKSLLVRVKVTERLPWEGISSTDVTWYKLPRTK